MSVGARLSGFGGAWSPSCGVRARDRRCEEQGLPGESSRATLRRSRSRVAEFNVVEQGLTACVEPEARPDRARLAARLLLLRSASRRQARTGTMAAAPTPTAITTPTSRRTSCRGLTQHVPIHRGLGLLPCDLAPEANSRLGYVPYPSRSNGHNPLLCAGAVKVVAFMPPPPATLRPQDQKNGGRT